MLSLSPLALAHRSTLLSRNPSHSLRYSSLSRAAILVLSGNPNFPSGVLRVRPMAQPHRSLSASSHAIGASSEITSENEFSNFMTESCLLIVGPGVLGKLVAEKWQQDYSGCHIVGQTMTTDHHNELVKLGINPSLKGRSDRQYPNVIFCAPPSRTADYDDDVRVALSNWNGDGCFLFTSSTAVYDRNDNGLCDEACPVVPIGRSPRTDVLLKAENTVLDAEGCVVRFAGLYKADRGAHIYALEKGIIDAHPDHILNLIHYEDAASLATEIMKRKLRGRIFLGCDNYPLSRQELMDCVNKSGKYSKKILAFTGTGDKLGKKMNNSSTRAEIGWEPKYSSFPSFLGLPKTTIHSISEQS